MRSIASENSLAIYFWQQSLYWLELFKLDLTLIALITLLLLLTVFPIHYEID